MTSTKLSSLIIGFDKNHIYQKSTGSGIRKPVFNVKNGTRVTTADAR
jgi:hypothetical protein